MPRRKNRNFTQRRSARSLIEPLESRTLLSANPAMYPTSTVQHSFNPASAVVGNTPAQILHAYGFDTLATAQDPANGAGQTIAIVDPYNDPTVLSDLNVFDAEFNLPAPGSFSVVNAAGGAALPRTDAGWAGEIATDVEWAHAIAPAANILLIETPSDNTSDLMTGVEYARTVPGVSVVSMSWGGSEFAGQTSYDSDFTTPSGHAGITFVAAAGDNAAAGGAQWPASSTNVVAVGGTDLTTGDNGVYVSETAWYSTSGGYSKFEAEPSWQKSVQRTGMRSMPDVSFEADSSVGLALYDSVPYQGQVGWQTTSGTSVGAPEFAALVAIADQSRAIADQTTLDGASQVLPTLYGLYGAPGTPAYTTYASDFHDITQPDYGQSTGLPTIGYDTATGLGSPIVAPVAAALAADSGASTNDPPASPLTVSFVNPVPASVVAGSNGTLKLKITNTTRSAVAGGATLTLEASPTVGYAADPLTIVSLPLSGGFGSKATRTIKLKFTYPNVSSQMSDPLAALVSVSADTSPAYASTTGAVTIAPPFIDVTPSFAAIKTSVHPGAVNTVVVQFQNLGNTVAAGPLTVSLYASLDELLDASDALLVITPTKSLHLLPGHMQAIKLHFLAPAADVPGTYFLLATATFNGAVNATVAAIGTKK